MPGPNRAPAGVKSQVKNPMAIFRRLMSYVTKRYLIQWIIVIVLIFVSVLANVQGTMFMQTLIDDYIMPMLGQDSPDFGPLAARLLSLAAVLAAGILYQHVRA